MNSRPLAGQDARFDALVRHVGRLARDAARDEFLARPMTEVVARALQGAELLRHTARTRSWTFLDTRGPDAAGAWGSHYGTLAGRTARPPRNASCGGPTWRADGRRHACRRFCW